METVKTVSEQCQRRSTGLKPGVNETTFEAKPIAGVVWGRVKN